MKEMIDKVYTTIQSLPEPYVWLHDKVEILRKGRISENPAFDFLWNLAERKVKESLEAIVLNRKKAASLQLDQAVALCEDDMIQIKKIEEKLGEYQALRDSLAAFKLSTLRKNYFTSAGDAGEQLKVFMEKSRNRVKKSMKDLYQDFFFQDQDEMLNEMAMTYDDAKFLEEVVLRYGQLYSQKKKEKNLVDFNDIEHYAYEILKDPQVSGFYREKFYHIFVDEYSGQEALHHREFFQSFPANPPTAH